MIVIGTDRWAVSEYHCGVPSGPSLPQCSSKQRGNFCVATWLEFDFAS